MESEMSVTGFSAISLDQKARLLVDPFTDSLFFRMEHRDPETGTIKNWVQMPLSRHTVYQLACFMQEWEQRHQDVSSEDDTCAQAEESVPAPEPAPTPDNPTR